MSFEIHKTGSAKGMVDDQRLEPECPECGASVPLTVGEARKSPTRRCPNGHEISFDAAELNRQISDIEKQMDGLFG